MKFMRRDFCAILRLGQLLIGKSNNPQNEVAVRKLVYGLASFLSPEDMESTVRVADLLDFDTAAATLTTLGTEEQTWAKELLYAVATIDGAMNAEQTKMWSYIENNCEFSL